MSPLIAGGNKALSQTKITIEISLPGGHAIDICAMQLAENGKVRGDGDMCFYNQPTIGGGAIQWHQLNSEKVRFVVALDQIETAIDKIVLTATLEKTGTIFGQVNPFKLQVGSEIEAPIETEGRTEAALILGEIYRRQGAWKFRNVSQGFNGGLHALATHFGVDIAEPAAEPKPVPKPVNLSKVSLNKVEKTVSLTKETAQYGKIRVNLNWEKKQRKGGLLGLSSTALDLDLGAFIEDVNGNITAVQALGNHFGDYTYFPYMRLSGDDRSGAVKDGEWLEINGDMWPEIHRILIFAFIYEGAPNWKEAGGIVKIFAPGQPEIEISMTEYGHQQGMCAVAYLENVGGQVKITREMQFFNSHPEMDQAYGWGLQWRPGGK